MAPPLSTPLHRPARPAPWPAVRHRPGRGLAWGGALLALAASVLLVSADRLVTQWTDALLFVAWLLLWGVVFVATALIDRWRRHRVAAAPLPLAERAPASAPEPAVDADAPHSRYGESLPYF